MKKLDLQLFAEPVTGKKIFYLYRILKEASTTNAQGIAFTSENGRSVSVESESTVTKDGAVRTPGTPEIEITATSYLAKGDTLIERLEEAQLNSDVVEIWEGNMEEPVENAEDKFKGTYYQGYLTGFEKTSSAEGYTEISLTFGINGTGKKGNVTVTAEEQEIADYMFVDTQKKPA